MSIPVVDYKPLSDGERRTAKEIARKIIAWADATDSVVDKAVYCAGYESVVSDDDVKPNFTVG